MKILKISLLCTSLWGANGAYSENIPAYKDRHQPIEIRVHDLLKRMTLEEKIAELNLMPYYTQRDTNIRNLIKQGKVGALLKANGAALNRSLQEIAIKKQSPEHSADIP